MNSNEIGRYIRVLRKREGMSQERLGELLELSYQQVQKYEQGKSKITLELLSRVSEVFSIPVTQLLEASVKEYSSPHLSGDAADAGEYERRELQETELLRQFRKLNTPFSREFVLRWIRGIAELERQCCGESPGTGAVSDGGENHDPGP
jgi:transcriptional regulator with XRE-family HTH domain